MFLPLAVEHSQYSFKSVTVYAIIIAIIKCMLG